MLLEIGVKLTNHCNDTCDHCVYRAGPKHRKYMTAKTAEMISDWLPQRHGKNISIFGGEITLIPHYPELLKILCSKFWQAGILTNGVFANNNIQFDKFVQTIKNLNLSRLVVRISQTQYHSGEYGKSAFDQLYQKFERSSNVHIQFLDTLEVIVPVGRAFDNCLGNEEISVCTGQLSKQISIDEYGMVYFCPLFYYPYKYFHKDSFDNIYYDVLNWRKKRRIENATCMSCSINGFKLYSNRKLLKTSA